MNFTNPTEGDWIPGWCLIFITLVGGAIAIITMIRNML